MPEKNSIEALLTQWSEEAVPEYEPQIIKNKIVEDNIMTINNLSDATTNCGHIDDIFTTNNQSMECFDRNNHNSVILNMNEGSNSESSQDVTVATSAFCDNTVFLPVDGGYIIVNEDGMMGKYTSFNSNIPPPPTTITQKKIIAYYFLYFPTNGQINPM